ncbi:hypothetical protein EXU57_24275 [Segetibacter sp. 3557_3]|uniref:hypothetical protein n=1 Tax=Segetibacter sp. 3557_3 TaxID=2547429 RepID=UPI0010588839|nr:hypothetical protein [Segetibacter sp. 3557_3]TDH18170.1 hypothetical protein EXU57_24275 [Segetibacter sp. 3557_3]
MLWTYIKEGYKAFKFGYAVGTAADRQLRLSDKLVPPLINTLGPAPAKLIKVVDRGSDYYHRGKKVFDLFKAGNANQLPQNPPKNNWLNVIKPVKPYKPSVNLKPPFSPHRDIFKRMKLSQPPLGTSGPFNMYQNSRTLKNIHRADLSYARTSKAFTIKNQPGGMWHGAHKVAGAIRKTYMDKVFKIS